MHPRGAHRRHRAGSRACGRDAGCGAVILEASALTKRFVGRAVPQVEFTAVSNVSFALRENEFVGIVGESGSGKSTLARLIVGLETPSEGRIAIAGGTSTAVRKPMRIAAPRPDGVPGPAIGAQSAPPRRQHRDAAARSGGTSHLGGRLARAGLLLREIGLPPEAATRFPAQLSGGQRQRVNIARALCAVPRILIADEIVSGSTCRSRRSF
jgi:peptide/nickel transport system ATP-binding protein